MTSLVEAVQYCQQQDIFKGVQKSDIITFLHNNEEVRKYLKINRDLYTDKYTLETMMSMGTWQQVAVAAYSATLSVCSTVEIMVFYDVIIDVTTELFFP